MTLQLKLNLIVGSLTLVIVSGVIALQFGSMRDSVKEEVVAANRVAGQLLNRTALLYAARGAPGMVDFLNGVGRVRSNDITLYDEHGGELYHSPGSAYKPGRSAPEWFDALISPPRAEQSIAFPDGRLVVRANASRAVLDAWESFVSLTAGAVALLALVLVVVYIVVGRTVRPFGRIVDALDQLQSGRFDVVLPPLAGSEAAAIGASFNRMVAVLRENIEAERRAAIAEQRLSDSRGLSRWMDRHIEQERRMIARELHDEFGQSVTAIRSMALSVAQRARGRDAASEEAAKLIADESSRLYDAMHGLIPRLAPLVLDNFGLAEALADLAQHVQASQPDLRIETRIDLPEQALPAETTLALYRAAQEGITNARRHGGATRIALSIETHGDALRLTLADNGRGLEAADAVTAAGEAPRGASGHYGLRWLFERVEGLGGSVSLRAGDEGGATLMLEVPLTPAMAPSAEAPAEETSR